MMMNETGSSSVNEQEYHRAKCAVCGVVCEQRRRVVMLLQSGDDYWAYDCLECEMIYVPSRAPVELPDGWAIDADATHMPEAYKHASGARVQRFHTDSADCWAWYSARESYGAKCRSPASSRHIAMAAALAATLSVAEQHARLEAAYGCVNCRIDRGARQCAESGHRSCDALKPESGAGDEP